MEIQNTIYDSLRQYIIEEVLEGEGIDLDENTPLLELGILNSMEIMKLVAFIERCFGVEVPESKIRPDSLGDLKTIESLIVDLRTSEQNVC